MKSLRCTIGTLLIILISNTALADCCPSGTHGSGGCANCSGGTNSCTGPGLSVCCAGQLGKSACYTTDNS